MGLSLKHYRTLAGY